MNKVKRAIILGAGKGTRLRPITYEVPKPLVNVNGKRIIDTIIEGLQKNGINEIYIVVGYLKEKFYELKNIYPDINIIENPYYENSNDISSLYIVKELVEDCIIMDADQIIYNYDILFSEFERSGYCCSWSEGFTNEWLLTLDNEGVITSCNPFGGEKGYRLYSISRWNKADGKTLQKYLEYEFKEQNNTQIYWDDVVLFCHPEAFNLGTYKIDEKDVVEIDSIDELSLIDNRYKDYKNEE